MTNKKEFDILFSGPVGYTLNEYNEASNVIYKSLERLETLEKNSDKVIKDSVKLINKNLELQARLETLNNVWHKNEPMESVDINANNLQELYDFNNKLIQENEKLKKAIEILNDTIILPTENDIAKVDTKGNIHYALIFARKLINEQEYELLKEVLDE